MQRLYTGNHWKKRPAPPGMRRELSGIIFDALIDQLPRDEVERRLKAVARNDLELAAALRRFDTTAGTVGVRV